VGIGVNVDWSARDFPPDLAQSMTSLRELAGGRPVDRDALCDAWLARLEPRYEALRAGAFDAGAWTARQRVIGRHVVVDLGDDRISGPAVGVDPATGALLMTPAGALEPVRIASGDVVRCRIVELPRRHV
jgi:BirA family biotin operon repressor/biotin-[acetyl-CoA-carboxylase] ligase